MSWQIFKNRISPSMTMSDRYEWNGMSSFESRSKTLPLAKDLKSNKVRFNLTPNKKILIGLYLKNLWYDWAVFDWVCNILGNAGYQNFLLFPQCFQKLSFSESFKVGIVWQRVYSLPNDKILDWSKLTAFADDKKILTEQLKFVSWRVEKIMGKGEKAGYQHFLIFPQCFKRLLFQGR